jgi:hypothetical protein
MRYILATALLMTVGMTSSASAGCGPAIQNWQNGSKMTCTYDSNGGGIETVAAAPAAAPTPPPQVEEKCYKEKDYGDDEGGGRKKSYKEKDYGDDEGSGHERSHRSHKSQKTQKQSKERGGNDA